MTSPDLSLYALALGRFLLGGLFVLGGVKHFFALEPITGALRARGVPAPRFVLIAGSLFQIVAGAAVMAGLYVTWSALGLVAFTILASLMLVNFWSLEKGPQRESLQNVFYSNLAIIGGLLVTAATA